MKNKMHTIFRICGIVGISALLIFGLSACWKGMTYAEAFKRNWEIDLPENMERLFYKSDSQGLAGQGDGMRYAVHVFEVEPTDFLTDFSREKDEKFEESVNNHISWTPLEIGEGFLPDWETGYYWKHVGKHYREVEDSGYYAYNLYMIFYPDSLRLICCECL